jgi:hypothetical protein
MPLWACICAPFCLLLFSSPPLPFYILHSLFSILISFSVRVSAPAAIVDSRQVDLALWGHVHNALVTCPVINGSCVTAPAPGAYAGPIHAVVGNGGQVLSGVPAEGKAKAAWVEYQANQWGWSQIFVYNATHLRMTFADDLKNELQYEFWIARSRVV